MKNFGKRISSYTQIGSRQVDMELVDENNKLLKKTLITESDIESCILDLPAEPGEKYAYFKPNRVSLSVKVSDRIHNFIADNGEILTSISPKINTAHHPGRGFHKPGIRMGQFYKEEIVDLGKDDEVTRSKEPNHVHRVDDWCNHSESVNRPPMLFDEAIAEEDTLTEKCMTDKHIDITCHSTLGGESLLRKHIEEALERRKALGMKTLEGFKDLVDLYKSFSSELPVSDE